MNNTKIVCMLGEGAWGTAVALLLADNGYTVNLWCHHAEVADDIKTNHINSRYLPGVTLPTSIIPTTDIQQAVCGSHWVFEAIPVVYLRSVLKKAQSCFTNDQIWVVLSKGIEQNSLLLPTQIIDELFGEHVKKAVFAGPSFAKEIVQKQITAATIASTDCTVATELQHLLANDYFRPYGSLDVIGVQAGAAIKNVITLGIGMLSGSGYNDNTKAFFLTRGLQEMATLITALGGTRETVYGLSGVGDLVLTAMGSSSRNLEVGVCLGKGETLSAIVNRTGYTPEGVNTVVSVQELACKKSVQMPLSRGVYEVLYKNKSIEQMLEALIKQPLEWECKK